MEHPIHSVVTIARQLGAGGAELGRRLSQHLGLFYLDREIVEQAARRIGAQTADVEHWDERISHFWERLFDGMSLGPPDSLYNTYPLPVCCRDKELFEVEARVIRELTSRHDAVVIGHAGFHILRKHPAAVHVYLNAPVEHRIPSIQRAYSLADEREARAMIERADAERQRFIREVTGADSTDARQYDLCINTARTGMDAAEQIVTEQLERVRRQPAPAPAGSAAM